MTDLSSLNFDNGSTSSHVCNILLHNNDALFLHLYTVPGFMGSRLHAKVTLFHLICSSSEPKLLWIKSLLHIFCIKYLK